MEEELVTHKFTLEDTDLQQIFGIGDVHLRIISDELGVKIVARGDEITIEGTEKQIEKTKRVFFDLKNHLDRYFELPESYVYYAVSMVKENGVGPDKDMSADVLFGDQQHQDCPAHSRPETLCR